MLLSLPNCWHNNFVSRDILIILPFFSLRKVDDLIEISSYAYMREDILEKEKQVLNKLDWYLTVPTLYMFLVRFIKAARADKQVRNNDFLNNPFPFRK
jgi:hypothetical protein